MTDYDVVIRYQVCVERLQKLGLTVRNDRGAWAIIPCGTDHIYFVTSSVLTLEGLVSCLEYKAKISEDKQEKPNGNHNSDQPSLEAADHQRVCDSSG